MRITLLFIIACFVPVTADGLRQQTRNLAFAYPEDSGHSGSGLLRTEAQPVKVTVLTEALW
jgi:hypothetical protein